MFRMINIHHQLQIKDQEPISKVKNLFCAKDAISKLSQSCVIYNWYKFTVVYCESVNLIGYIIVCYLPIINSYASVHIARHV